MAVAGSHRRLVALAAELAPANGPCLVTEVAIAELARREPWFAELFAAGTPASRRARFVGRSADSAGVPVRVVELTGRAGDVVFMDPRVLHTISANVRERPRLCMRLVCQRAS